jgi:23S rRNA (cytosine1962-C5)-methyltransferase
MVLENGCAAQIDLTTAQKTGWFYDHRENRAYLSRLVSGKSVLDVFSYVGGWSLLALKKGASQVTAIDSSQAAGTLLLESAQHDARLNFIHEDAFKALKQLREQQRCFEVIILDPPAFIKKRKDLRDGRIAYLRLHQQALRLLAKPGLLVSASCSMLLKSEELQELALQAARAAGRELRLIYRGQQGPDHPIHPAIAETEYLKMLLWWVY